jgi:hypothetical protein
MTIAEIHERWAYALWRYQEQRDGDYIAGCQLMLADDKPAIDLDEPQIVEQNILKLAVQAPDDIRELLTEIGRLRTALEYYALATIVSSWGMEELAPNWDVARKALRLPEPTPSERRKALGEAELFTCEDCGRETATMDGKCYACHWKAKNASDA